MGCSTGGCSTIQIEQKLGCSTQIMFDGKLTIVEHRINRTKSEKWLCSINSYFDFENEQLSNKKLIELNQESDYVRLILCLTNVMFNNGRKLYIFCWKAKNIKKCEWLCYVRLGNNVRLGNSTCSWPNLT